MKYRSILIFLLITNFLSAQDDEVYHTTINGQDVEFIVTEDNDTLIIAELEDISVSSPREFASTEEYRKYLKYRRYANKVYPYAVRAIKIFEESKVETKELSRRKKKRHMKKLQHQLDDEFEKPLKKLTKTQGKILVKMIEKETDESFYNLIKGLRGTWTASYWSGFSRIYGYKLKEGYVIGEDKILDIVLKDYNISYDVD